MNFLIRYGAISVFAAVFFEHVGLPIPAVPIMLAAGALAGAGKMNSFTIMTLALAGALLGDWIWYELGRRKGIKVLSTLCRVSMEPDTCVRKTENTFARYGVRTLIGSKFVPGLNRVAPPLAGIFNISLPRFLWYDGIGSLLYLAPFFFIGFVFKSQVEKILSYLESLGKWAILVLAVCLAIYILFKWLERQWVIRKLRIARITPEELNRKMEANEPVFIVDLRSQLDVTALPYVIPGALHIPAEDFEKRHQEIPRGQDIVVYCSCPNEVTSAKIAIKLRKKGVNQVRPLLGGITGWRYQEFDLNGLDVPKKA